VLESLQKRKVPTSEDLSVSQDIRGESLQEESIIFWKLLSAQVDLKISMVTKVKEVFTRLEIKSLKLSLMLNILLNMTSLDSSIQLE
jgi:hypothetical protein